MKSVLDIFSLTYGPNSLLNSAPYSACVHYIRMLQKTCKEKKIHIDHVEVNLYNELARLNEQAKTYEDIETAFDEADITVVVNTDKKITDGDDHPLRFDFIAFKSKTEPIFANKCYSIGGGFFKLQNYEHEDTYPFKTWKEIEDYMDKHKGMTFYEFCSEFDDLRKIEHRLDRVIAIMDGLIVTGLSKSGRLKLHHLNINYNRRASKIYASKTDTENVDERMIRKVSAYAYAIGEEVTGKTILCTKPSIGSCAAFWAILRYVRENFPTDDVKVKNALCAAALVCSLVLQNGTISSNVAGCQSEMGTAAAMAAAAISVIMYNADVHEVGRAAEMAIEHSLGLICNTVCSVPIVPCIQRSAAFAIRGLEVSIINHWLMDTPELVKLDDIVKVMFETGNDLLAKNKQVGTAGFAKDAAYSIISGAYNPRADMFADLDKDTPDFQRTTFATGKTFTGGSTAKAEKLMVLSGRDDSRDKEDTRKGKDQQDLAAPGKEII